MYSLAQAAKATGESKPTIGRAIKSSKLSAVRHDDGSYAIDPSELARVYPSPGDVGGAMKQHEPLNGVGTYPAAFGEVEGLRALLAECDARIADKDAIIEDLHKRLDSEAEERRRLAALLTDQRPVEHHPWSRRWFGA
jgi:hypothetical protein